jgi:hypothetical protein
MVVVKCDSAVTDSAISFTMPTSPDFGTRVSLSNPLSLHLFACLKLEFAKSAPASFSTWRQ